MVTELIEQIIRSKNFQTLSNNYDEYRNKVSELIMFICDTRLYNDAIEFIKFTTYSDDYEEKLVSFLRQKKVLSDDIIYKLLHENIVKRGFVFHGTASSNVEFILDDGLKTISSMYGKEFRYEVLEINQIYNNVCAKNNSIGNTNPINIGKNDDEFNSIYLTPNARLAYNYTSYPSEWFFIYYKNMINNAKLPSKFEDDYGINYSVERKNFEKACYLICGTEDSNYNEFINFYDKYYPHNKAKGSRNSIVFVSVKSYPNYDNLLERIPSSWSEFKDITNSGYPLHAAIKQLRIYDDNLERNQKGDIDPKYIEAMIIPSYKKDGYFTK